MIHWRFKLAAVICVFSSFLQLGFSLVFVTTPDAQPIVTFCVSGCATLLLILVSASHNYADGDNMFYERVGLTLYNMVSAVKLVFFASDVLCSACHATAAVRIGFAFLENAVSNVVQAHIWRRTEKEILNSFEWENETSMVALPRRSAVDAEAQREYNQQQDLHDTVSIDDASTVTTTTKID
jgi:hypothetical protein